MPVHEYVYILGRVTKELRSPSPPMLCNERGNKMNKINKGNEHKLLAIYGNGGSKVPSSVHA